MKRRWSLVFKMKINLEKVKIEELKRRKRRIQNDNLGLQVKIDGIYENIQENENSNSKRLI